MEAVFLSPVQIYQLQLTDPMFLVLVIELIIIILLFLVTRTLTVNWLFFPVILPFQLQLHEQLT